MDVQEDSGNRSDGGLIDVSIMAHEARKRLGLDAPLRLPAENPMSQPKPHPAIHITKQTISILLKTISMHPLWSTIIGGIVILLFSHFVFKAP